MSELVLHPDEVLDTHLVRRKAFAAAAAHGMGIDELSPSDPKAVHELGALVSRVFHDYSDMGTL